MKENETVILGVDPGTIVTGYGIIRIQNRSFVPIDYGCIRPPAKAILSDRYLVIFNSIEELIHKYQPSVLAFELQYVSKNVQSALKLSMARMAAALSAKKKGLRVFGYSPSTVKKAVTSSGSASKHQVQGMVQQILNLTTKPEPEDAADALALAICHGQTAAHLDERYEF